MIPEKSQIFLVSDDPVLQEEVRFGFPQVIDVAIAPDARRAWKLMDERAPSVAVIEIRTGSAGGFGLARDMSQHRELRRVPILMLIEREQDRWLAETAGAKTILVQPVDTATLVVHALALLPARASA
jgi:DNA-binding response OmpR family regulator